MAKWIKSSRQTNNSGGTNAQTGLTLRVTTPLGAESTTQTQDATTGTTAQTNIQTGTQTKKTDAGFIISFSVPLRGGLYNDGSANPPL